MYEKLAMDCRTLSRINVMFSNKAETWSQRTIIQNGGEPEITKQNYWFAYQFLVTSLSLQTMEFKPPSNTESKSNCYNSGGFQWISTSCWRRSVHTERGLHQNCPIIICWHMWHIWVREKFLVLLFRYPSYRPSWTHSTSTDFGY